MAALTAVSTSATFDGLGPQTQKSVHRNLCPAELYEHALRRDEGRLAAHGPLVVLTGEHTGRAAADKFIVSNDVSRDAIAWGDVNVAVCDSGFDSLRRRILEHVGDRDVYVQDLCAGADPAYRLNVRIVTEQAWHSLFSRNLFILPAQAERDEFEPDFTIVQAPSCRAVPSADGCRSETAIMIDFARRLVLIAGTAYAGEIKKSVFTILNFLLPAKDVLPMHCSVNESRTGESAVFFGLSGTGKTTLSADPARRLIGDDEHGWGDRGLFNFEGGCYAKVIRLSAEAEPEIFATTRRFGTVLENVVMDPDTRRLNLDDNAYTENTRAAYPLDHIDNVSRSGLTGHPRNVIMLTADAFGVLPPVSRLTPEQASYHFLSGYTAKIAGTESGLGNEPKATFSTCFGAPFMPRDPCRYGELLDRKIREHGVACWLVNTGWFGGAYGVGKRMPIGHTRAMLNAVLDGSLDGAAFRQDENFRVWVPRHCPGVPDRLLDPRTSWADGEAYDSQARALCLRFAENFAAFRDRVGPDVRNAEPCPAA